MNLLRSATDSQAVAALGLAVLFLLWPVGPAGTAHAAELLSIQHLTGRLMMGKRSTVDESASWGTDVDLGADVTVGQRARLGHWVVIGDHTAIAADVVIGDSAVLGRHVRVGDRAEIGRDVAIGDATVVGRASVIGAGASIGNDVVIQDRAVVFSRAKIPDHTVVRRTIPPAD